MGESDGSVACSGTRFHASNCRSLNVIDHSVGQDGGDTDENQHFSRCPLAGVGLGKGKVGFRQNNSDGGMQFNLLLPPSQECRSVISEVCNDESTGGQ